ncbi:MAG: GGDEF domain-containing protein [Clostridia bacterium]|nr:GGDEF domain-containing protein [Clostridia bacterium]
MESKVGIVGNITEIIVLFFNVLIYMQLTVLKKDNRITRCLMYGGSVVIIGLFFVLTYTGILAEALASFLCVTVPSFLLFFALSKYKDFRFFVTFCFLDTITFIITFFTRAIDVVCGMIPGIISSVIVCLLILIVYIKGKPYFHSYRKLMENVKDGWETMALSSFLIYILLIFTAAYPKPLIERIEYLPVYLFLSITVLSFYALFVVTLMHKKKLSDLNARLMQEKQWHKIAYRDALTGLRNRMSYIEKINELERTLEKTDVIYAVMIDINNFKKINDTLGHHVGDLTLQNVAKLLSDAFSEEHYTAFRIGGDEFAIIAKDVSEDTLKEKIKSIKTAGMDSDIGCPLSVGYSAVDFEQDNIMENAFIRADNAMYKDKAKSKMYQENK